MPTNEERREVAEEMRQRAREGYAFSRFNIAEEIGMYEGDYDDPYIFENDCWLRLANLIEPEPERTCRNEAGESGYGDDEFFYCSECGRVFFRNDFEELDKVYAGLFDYCPNCGAKVVES